MAEAIGTSLGTDRISFASAGLVAGTVDTNTIHYLKDKGIDTSHQGAKSVDHIPDLDRVQVIVALCEEAEKIFPPAPTKTVGLEWKVQDPSTLDGSPEERQAAYDQAFTYLTDHINDLAHAILGDNQREPKHHES
jgi:arsenate reductase